jgi:hypothetical protein
MKKKGEKKGITQTPTSHTFFNSQTRTCFFRCRTTHKAKVGFILFQNATGFLRKCPPYPYLFVEEALRNVGNAGRMKNEPETKENLNSNKKNKDCCFLGCESV